MTTKPMTEQEAVEVLKRYVRETERGRSYVDYDARAALAALEGKHIYVSRFKPGDQVYLVVAPRRRGQRWWISEQPWMWCMIDPNGPDAKLIFPTREEAEAECKHRNEKGA